MTIIPSRSISNSGNGSCFLLTQLLEQKGQYINPYLDWHQKAFPIAMPPLTLLNCKNETFLKFTPSSLRTLAQSFQATERYIHPVWNFNNYDKFIIKWEEVAGSFVFKRAPTSSGTPLTFHSWPTVWPVYCKMRQDDSKYHSDLFCGTQDENSQTEVRKMGTYRKSTPSASYCWSPIQLWLCRSMSTPESLEEIQSWGPSVLKLPGGHGCENAQSQPWRSRSWRCGDIRDSAQLLSAVTDRVCCMKPSQSSHVGDVLSD